MERYRGGRNLLTPHPPEAYPGIRVVRPGPRWPVCLITPRDGETVVAQGGEHVLGYVTAAGLPAQGFLLGAGDRARMVAWGLPASMVEWEVERAPLPGQGAEAPLDLKHSS